MKNILLIPSGSLVRVHILFHDVHGRSEHPNEVYNKQHSVFLTCQPEWSGNGVHVHKSLFSLLTVADTKYAHLLALIVTFKVGNTPKVKTG